MTDPSVAVVIPLHNGIDLLGPCLATVGAEARATGATLVVVDDNSDDGSADAAADAGAEVIRLPRSGGPYVARNVGWRSTSTDVVVFTDVRCRARPGWLRALVSPLDDPLVVVAAGISTVELGPSLAARAMYQMQPLDSRRSAEGGFLPWGAGANLATRREVLTALDGFREVRSGGDVDFCWRAQLELGGRLAVADDAVMTWEPRRTLTSCIKQWYRYGRHHPALYNEYIPYGATFPFGKSGPIGPVVRELWSLAGTTRRKGVHGLNVALAVTLLRAAENTGHWVGVRELRRDRTRA